MGDTSHVVPLPRWIFFIRIAQALLALLVIALVAYSTSIYMGSYMVSAYGVNLFTGPLTLAVVGYNALTPIYAASLYNCWAALALEVLTLIMWLASFAILASYSSGFGYATYHSSGSWLKQKRSTYYRAGDYETAWQTGAAASGIGGIEFVLFIITLVVFSIYLHRHRGAAASAQQPPVYSGQPVDYSQPTKMEPIPAPAQQQYPAPVQQYPPQQYATPPPNPQQQYPPPQQQFSPQQPQQPQPQQY